MLAQSIDANATDKEGSTALHMAATYGNSVTAGLLLEKVEIMAVDNQNQNVLHRAAEEGKAAVVNKVLEYLENNDVTGTKLKEMMKTRDKRGNTPFMLAVQSGNHETLKTFIDKAQSGSYVDVPNIDNECPLHMACRSLTKSTISKSHPLIPRSGDKATTELLYNTGANINRLNNHSESPLFIAADYTSNLDLVKFLCEK